MNEGMFLWGALIGFVWGEWFAERRMKKRAAPDVGMKLLLSMFEQVQNRRRLVGRGLTITRSETFDIRGNRYTISLRSDGDPTAIEQEDAA